MSARSPALNEEVFSREAGTSEEVMTIPDVVRASLALLTILIITGALGWYWIGDPGTTVSIPAWFWVGLLGALAVGILTVVKPNLAPFTAPAYAALEGLVIGAISRLFEYEFEGIVLQAVMLTVGVFAVLLGLYASRLIKVTENFRLGVIAATGAIFLVYLVNLILHFFGLEVPYIHDTGPVGIIISLVIVTVAALNLVLDFDFIERAVTDQAPRSMRWYAAFGLVVTLVWLYLEILRLLGKIRS
ncbi:MAG TPA: Bax inhibitor-1/YccA family protein [Solirubrobacterales bacterium]|nr:Bax inhibitor-1/YccA family protein [Solirubrobacterales bacterium]